MQQLPSFWWPMVLWSVGIACAGCKASAPMNGDIISSYRATLSRDGEHAGMDIYAEVGESVLAIDRGLVVGVIEPGPEPQACGHGVVLFHPRSQMYVSYCHLQRVTVSILDAVDRGDSVGLAGNVAGYLPHLHVEICSYPSLGGHADGRLAGTSDPEVRLEQCGSNWPVRCARNVEPPPRTAPGTELSHVHSGDGLHKASHADP